MFPNGTSGTSLTECITYLNKFIASSFYKCDVCDMQSHDENDRISNIIHCTDNYHETQHNTCKHYSFVIQKKYVISVMIASKRLCSITNHQPCYLLY